MTSIAEVARRAGVSTATASRVLAASDYPVSAATRQRVLDAASALDYVPNALARGLLKRQVPVVGVIVHDITDPYFNEVVRGVEDAASAAGYLVITCSSDRDPAQENSYVRLLRSMRAAAVIFAGSGIDDAALNEELGRHLVGIRSNGSAVVHLSPHAFGVPEVGVDNVGAMVAMVAALVRLGHRRIGFLAGPARLYVARERLVGYRDALRAAQIGFDPALVVESGFDQRGGMTGVDALLEAAPDVTAVCCANDLLAIGALARLAERGIDVPGRLSVSGVDDVSIAAMTSPALTTVRIPLRELGQRAFAVAVAQMSGTAPPPVVLPTEVVLRASTGPPPELAMAGSDASRSVGAASASVSAEGAARAG
ncbi:MAG TPA: LacI family DNA-binding transcriptional regulator [Candidatus Limnocylindria bacterium]|nr:LacI family DNA-binding transcriptional regulator [Candidatus Limnocylindria bacterium]